MLFSYNPNKPIYINNVVIVIKILHDEEDKDFVVMAF